MPGYTPLFSSIVTSSIWAEDNATRIVWITMLALADQNGVVEGSVPGLAHIARVRLEDCQKALWVLMNPDQYSRTTEYEGRRIHTVDGGWQIYNFAKFRRRAKHGAEYYRHWRDEKKKSPNPLEENTNNPKLPQTRATTRNQVATVVGCALEYTIDQVKDACNLLAIPEQHAQSYYDHYGSQGWRKANGQQITELRGHMKKRWTGKGWDFDEKTGKSKGGLFPLPGKICSKDGCGLPAVYRSSGGAYDHYYCHEHMPEKVKEKYT